MTGVRRTARLALGLLALFLCAPPDTRAKIFKYVDRDGNIHVVDDESLIPPDCRPDTRVYRDPEDDLSPEDRAKLREIRQQEREDEAARRRIEDERKAREAYLKSLETPVIIRGNQVLVPVEVGYRGRKAELTLLLDTGATHTLIYRHAVAHLDLDNVERSHGRVAGGYVVRTYQVRLGHLKVGPWTAEDVPATLMDHVGPDSAEQGLLGMDFLKHRDYRIDYEKQLIRWAEPGKKRRN